MDYKDKLRLAKEALDSGSYDKETIEYIFPELAESEDEKIRNFLIDFIKECGWTEKKDQGWPLREECIDWLEKQGEQKSTDKVELMPTWSKEDEMDFDVIYGIIYNSCNAEDASRLIAWLKAIKDRVQPKSVKTFATNKAQKGE